MALTEEEALEIVDSVDTEIQDYLSIEVNEYPDLVTNETIQVLEISEYESSNQRMIEVNQVYEKLTEKDYAKETQKAIGGCIATSTYKIAIEDIENKQEFKQILEEIWTERENLHFGHVG